MAGQRIATRRHSRCRSRASSGGPSQAIVQMRFAISFGCMHQANALGQLYESVVPMRSSAGWDQPVSGRAHVTPAACWPLPVGQALAHGSALPCSDRAVSAVTASSTDGVCHWPTEPFAMPGAKTANASAISTDLNVSISVPGDIVPGDVVPAGLVPGNVVPGNVVPRNIVPASVVPDDVVPDV